MKLIRLIFAKEAREMLRDRRVLMGAVIGPLTSVLLMVMAFGVIFSATRETIRIGIVDGRLAPGLLASLSRPSSTDRETKFDITGMSTKAEALRALKAKRVRLAVVVPKDYAIHTRSSGSAQLIVYFNPNDEMSKDIALNTFRTHIATYSAGIVARRLGERDLSLDFIQPIKMKAEEAFPRKGGASDFIVQLLPYLIVIWTFFGGQAIVSDLVAGEKERGTMETLLVSPASRTQIVLGKFLALCLVCVMSALLSVIAIQLTWVLQVPGAKEVFKGGIQLRPLGIALITLALVPLTVFFSAVSLALSTFARNQREAQTYLAVVATLVTLPAFASMFVGYTGIGNAWYLGAIPVLNVATVLRQVLMNQVDFAVYATTIITSAAYAAAALAFAIFLFRRESILFRV